MHKRLQTWQKSLRQADAPDEWEVKQLLTALHIRVPRGIRIASRQALPPIPFDPPFVVKACSPSILHKTDQQGVQLNVQHRDLSQTISLFRKRFQKSALLIEEQISFMGPEMIVGALSDASFGPAVMAGSGGILTELYSDVAFRLAPCSAREAAHMLSELKIAPALSGYRGLFLDPQKLSAMIAQVSQLADALSRRLGQLDLNPVVFAGGNWVVLDAKLIFSPETRNLAKQ